MSDRMYGQTFLVDPAEPIHAPSPKVSAGGLASVTPVEEKIARQLDETTLRALRLIHDALNGKTDLSGQDERTKLGLASSVLGAWSRYQQTQTARWSLQMRTHELAARDVTPRLSERTQ